MSTANLKNLQQEIRERHDQLLRLQREQEDLEGSALRDKLDKVPVSNAKRLTTWKNKGWINTETPAEVARVHKKLYDNIVNEYQNTNTRKSHLSTLVDTLKRQPGFPEKTILKYSDSSVDLAKKVKADKADNKLSARRAENPINFQRIVDLRDKLKQDMDDKTVISKKDNIYYLILAINTLQPPLRSDTLDMFIIDEKDLKKNKKDNLLVKRKDGTYYYLIRQFKQRNKKDGREEKIEITPQLKKAIDWSFNHFQRGFLLPNLSNHKQPMGYNQWKNIVEKLLGKTAGVDIFRSAYASWFINSKNRTNNELERLAEQMLTSKTELLDTYRIIPETTNETVFESSTPEELFLPKKKQPFNTLVQVNPIVKDKILEEREARKNYHKKYYNENKEQKAALSRNHFEKNKEEIYKKRIIAKLKNDLLTGENTVRQSTIDKYGITQEDLA